VTQIRTGELEEHIVADVAWAASEYAAWTGDAAFVRGPGADLLLDTARYWASRVTIEDDGRGHVRGVIGPDEYHEVVDDNAFTNVMARWNLRRGADLADEFGRGDEAARWRRLASIVVDGWDAARRLYEQFAGYWSLEPLLIDQVAGRPVAADVVLGARRVRGSQLLKQADVLMLHHLVPGEVEPGSLETNLAFYEPRTAHGSSLSPAIHAGLLARAGEPDRALVPFRMAARLDLDDLTGTTAGGLHLATMGGLWQALAYGFCGLRPGGDVLHIDPRLPSEWSALALQLVFRGEPLGIRAEHDRVVIDCATPLIVRIGGADPQTCRPPGQTYEISDRRGRRRRTR
jgi:trehalose/maltose hydrolase-like predicted phosphorylase